MPSLQTSEVHTEAGQQRKH